LEREDEKGHVVAMLRISQEERPCPRQKRKRGRCVVKTEGKEGLTTRESERIGVEEVVRNLSEEPFVGFLCAKTKQN